jgi:hypothetical protein
LAAARERAPPPLGEHRAAAPLALDDLEGRAAPSGTLFWPGVLVSVTNPKALTFYAALFPQFIDRGSAPDRGSRCCAPRSRSSALVAPGPTPSLPAGCARCSAGAARGCATALPALRSLTAAAPGHALARRQPEDATVRSDGRRRGPSQPVPA